MLFVDFKSSFYELGCFNIHQIHSWQPGFNNNNLTRWVENAYLVKLRNGFYCFPEYLKIQGFNLYIANRIYKPSYISLHYALHFYGLIPESTTVITSVSSLKTMSFKNDFGTFSYQTLQPALLFGYTERPFLDRTILFATPEKAILDLLYLYPFYNTDEELELLRLDNAVLENDLNIELLNNNLSLFKNKSLETRVKSLLNVYRL